jgi:hypothetical protein
MAGFEVTHYGRFWVTPEDLNAQLQPKLAQIDWNSCILATVVQIGEHICASGFIAYAKHSQ